VTARTRIFAGVLLVYLIGVGVLMYRLLADIDPRYRESAEESLVETAHLLAAAVEQQAVMAAKTRAVAAAAAASAAIAAQAAPAATAIDAAPVASAAGGAPAA